MRHRRGCLHRDRPFCRGDPELHLFGGHEGGEDEGASVNAVRFLNFILACVLQQFPCGAGHGSTAATGLILGGGHTAVTGCALDQIEWMIGGLRGARELWQEVEWRCFPRGCRQPPLQGLLMGLPAGTDQVMSMIVSS